MDRREYWRRLHQRPRNVTFAELERLLILSGWTREGARGSHVFYTRDRIRISVPFRRGTLLVAYVREVLNRTREEGDEQV